MKRFLVAICLAATPVVSSAQVTGLRSTSFVPFIPTGRVTNRLVIDTLGDVVELQIVLSVPANSVYQNGSGATNGPSFYCPPWADCGEDVPFNPAIVYDSFVTMGSFDYWGNWFGDTSFSVDLLGPAGHLLASGGSAVFDTSRLDIAWAASNGAQTGAVTNFPIAQITLRNTATGTLHYYARAAGGEAWVGSAPVVAGVIQLSVPESASALLMAWAVPALVVRRR